MGKKTIVPASEEAKNAFDAGMERIQESNSAIPNISKDDKKGAKLLKKIEPLINEAIEHAPKFEEHLPRKFDVQELVDDQAAIALNLSKIAALEIQVQHLKDANAVAGIRMRKNYRIVLDAATATLKNDNSVSAVCERLAAPYKRTPMSDEKKAENAKKALEKATIKAEMTAQKVVDKAAKKA